MAKFFNIVGSYNCKFKCIIGQVKKQKLIVSFCFFQRVREICGLLFQTYNMFQHLKGIF